MSDPTENPAGAQFQSLYRRFRPQRFEEVRGQSHVTLALRNAVRDSHVAHAYLFSGPRGTGKTSTARILAKALNCTAIDDGEPCGTCDSCRSITSGNSFDVHELDAASNNGVDAMRDLVARSSLATPGRWKVYIVDEVHMLSAAASNALLKTLEEPPDHVVFVLATTDPQKVLATIRSRTQQYEFHLMADDVLAGLVDDIAASAGLSLPDGAASQAVRRGRGSARDTLSILDQVAAAGVVDDDTGDLANVVSAMAAEDGQAALVALDRAVRQGRDPQQIAVDLVETLRAGFLSLAGASSVAEGVARTSTAELEVLRSLGLARCVRGMEIIGTAIVAMRDAPEPRITLEIAVFRSASLDADNSVDALAERLERLERRIETLGSAASSAPATPPPPPPPPPRTTARTAPPPEPRDDHEEVADEPAAGEVVPPTPPPLPPPPVAPTPVGPSPTDLPPGTRPTLGAFRPQRPAAEAPPVPREQRPPAAEEPTPPPPPVVPTDLPAPVEGGAPATPPRTLPDRDAFVLAWGDAVLTGLRPRTRMLYNVGHFISAEGGVGVFALPNAFHVQMADAHRDEVGAALSDHLGVPVTIRLVVDDRGGTRSEEGDPPDDDNPPGGTAARAPAPPPGSPAAAEETVDLDDVGEPIEEGEEIIPTGAEWAADRLRAAFPGTEEVPS